MQKFIFLDTIYGETEDSEEEEAIDGEEDEPEAIEPDDDLEDLPVAETLTEGTRGRKRLFI